MAKEIEHKYLVISEDYKNQASECLHIMQGYLCDEIDRTVRVRTRGSQAFLTIKGRNDGATRVEYEYEIPYADAQEMLHNLCKQPIIDKHRHIVMHEGHRWEIDEFHGLLEGLTLAEIELPFESYTYNKPDFVGKNVTDDPRYYNSALAASGKVPQQD